MTLTRIYNYPWSGRLGRITPRCIYCGEDGPVFQLSSRPNRCLNCKADAQPNPELLKAMQDETERLAREWCKREGIDYEQTILDLWNKHNGPPDQER